MSHGRVGLGWGEGRCTEEPDPSLPQASPGLQHEEEGAHLARVSSCGWMVAGARQDQERREGHGGSMGGGSWNLPFQSFPILPEVPVESLRGEVTLRARLGAAS